ncbi:cell division topological specificity factor MinE [Clostridium sp. cel8]|uniref:cell division topological specificity factor MinE n=1 Tax=unclassified Clostridium TaxID=2614128 RepID=UPI0015F6918C|nr:cell division topological specificity factor MinE [Clostridium sp. cel8]MBA5849923.1 cell division topological specificity factor MinE [Clostridium sp. cel8]
MDLLNMFSKQSSKKVAKERLRLILIHDRSNISPDLLENIKEDILKVLSKYMEVDFGDIDVKMTSEKELDAPALIASVPIKNVKHKK